MYITTLTGDKQFIEKKCYNVTVPVTMFKYLPFNAVIDYVWKIPSNTAGPISVECLSVCCKKIY